MHTPLGFMNNSEALNEGNRRYCSKKLLYTSRSWESAIEDDSYTNSLPLAIFRGHETQITQILILKLLKNFEELGRGQEVPGPGQSEEGFHWRED